MEERRRTRRFNLKLPCLICLVEPDSAETNDVFHMETHNISTNGAYLTTAQILPPGTRMDIDVLVRRAAGEDNGHTGSCISVRGEVVRTDEMGMAVKFDNQYQISRITKLIAHNRTKTRWMEMLAQNFGTVCVSARQCKESGNPGIKDRAFPPAVGNTQADPVC